MTEAPVIAVELIFMVYLKLRRHMLQLSTENKFPTSPKVSRLRISPGISPGSFKRLEYRPVLKMVSLQYRQFSVRSDIQLSLTPNLFLF